MSHVKTMGAAKFMEDVVTTATNPVTVVEEDMAHKTTEISAEAVVVDTTVILHIIVGHMECVSIRVKTTLPQQMVTKRTQCGVKICRVVRETAPDRSGRYLLIKLTYMKSKTLIYLNYYVALL